MTDGLSRRNLMILAGAGAALAACKREVEHSDKVPEELSPDTGRWPSHGANPNIGPQYPNNAPEPDFNPGYITLVHIDFPRPWTISINHACFKYAEDDENERLKKAISLFKAKRPGLHTRKRFSVLDGQNMPYRRHGKLDFDNFDNFGFASQHEIFFYFDNADILLREEWLISFAPGSHEGQSRDKSYSFFYAKHVPVTLYGLQRTGWIVRVRNYFTKEDGTAIDLNKQALTHSMNLHFSMKTPTGHVPMIIDPDTGNGQGNEP